jgi:hypothetical protein
MKSAVIETQIYKTLNTLNMKHLTLNYPQIKAFFILLVRRMCGLISLPFLYTRYSIIFFIPLILIKQEFIIIWFLYALFFSFIMKNCGVMQYWTKLFQLIFKVKYEIVGQWTSDMMHSYSVWSHPILKIREKEYKLSIAVMGGNLYQEEDNLRRKAIVYWLLG